MKKHIPGMVLTGIYLLAAGRFYYILATAKLLADKYLWMLLAVLVVLGVLIGLLTWSKEGKKRFIIGILLLLLSGTGLAVGTYYVNTAIQTLKEITEVAEEVSYVGVYVLRESSIQEIADLQDRSVGVLGERNRAATEAALAELDGRMETPVQTVNLDTIGDLADMLNRREVDAILFNEDFIPLLAETEGYENFELRLREVERIQVKVTTKMEADAAEKIIKENSQTKEEIAPFVVFISGIDTTGDVTTTSRSDVNILAVVNPQTHQVLLVSTPRDYFVPLSISNGARDKLTHAGIYGIECSKDTLSMLYGIPVDYYFRVNFTGFQEIIDALGGITVNSRYTFSAQGFSFQEGPNYVYGKQALAFARERHSFEEGDRQRGKNQMEVIKGVINKLNSKDMLKNYSGLMTALSDSFATDVPYDVIAAMVREQLESGKKWNIVSTSVDGMGDSQVPYSMSATAYVMWPDESSVEKAKEQINTVLTGGELKR